MKMKRLYSLIIAILLTAIGIQAQETNKLYVPDIRVGAGESAMLPVYVQNSSKNITGIQFTIEVENGVSVNINNATMTERLANHKMKVATTGIRTYNIMVYSTDNTVLTGNDGIVVNIPVSVANTEEIGASKSVVLTKAVLSDNLGNNVLTEFTSGTVKVIKYPQLLLSAESTEVKEGEKIIFTITNEDAPSAPLQISISSDMPGRLKYPSSVTMEANSSSVSFEVEALDNGEVSDTLTAAFKVSATEHKDGESLLLIIDDDMPEIELELKPNTVSEGDGLSAVIGKITRKTKIENKVTIVLSDDSNGNLYYSNKRITMPAGTTEVEFTMGAVDNAAVEDARHYNVTAAVYIPSCSCSAKETSIGYVTKPITITDDDGPTLKITSEASSVKEGSNISFTISHNVDSETDVTVELMSDNDDAFEYEHSITIPAGMKTVQVIVKAKGNETIEGNRTIVFTVKTDGFATGTCYIQLTDQTIPDASITNFSVTPTEIEVGQKASLSITLNNIGNAALPSLTRVNFYISNSTTELGHVYTADTLSAGSELTLTHEIEMPNVTGQYSLRAVVNEDRAFKELTYTNNSSRSIPVTLLPAFTATALSDKTLYATGETVTISGKATGTKAANSDVEVYLINESNRQTITAHTDEEGNYSVEYALPKSMSGHFVIGACYPKEDLRTEMATFDVYGIRLSACSNNCEFDLGDTFNGTMTITNAVSFKQTGLKVTQSKSPEDCEFVFTLAETVEADESLILNFTITPSAVTAGREWQKMPITITSNEGASTDYCINYYINSRNALLSSDIKSINTTMTKGTKREYPITITNKGKGETGKITLALPEWIKTSTPQEMASLQQGDTATIVLQLSPTDDMQLNVPVSGRLGINCENGSGIPINFSITPVSETDGKLIVDVVDEFTFETSEAPHVSNAKIEIKRPVTGEVIAQGKSGEDGKFSVTIPEGQYSVSITAENHENYTNQIVVDAGKDNNHEAFVSYEAVTYSWDVVETEVEDSYQIETIVKFDTRVPKPVILISLPDERPEDGSIIPIVVTNKGFINAEDVNVSLAISGDYSIDFLTEPYLAKLAANQTEVFYARISPKNTTSASKRAPSLEECLSLQAKLRAHYICGNKYDNTVTADDLRRWGQCLDYARCQYSYGGRGYGGYSPGGNGNTSYGSGWWQIVPIPTRACSPGSWNNNPDYLDDPDKPIGLNKFKPEKKDGPYKHDCDSKDELQLVYRIIPVTGTQYLLNGVAADGISQVKLVLDPDSSTVPPQDCENFYDFEWKLSKENYGKIEGDSYMEAIYTAPENFPVGFDRMQPKAEVEATLWYTQRIDDHTTYGRHSTPVKIEIIRPPVVFVHGLGDSDTCWYRLDKSLTDYRYYEHGINYRINYKNTNTSAFDANVYEIGRGLLTARRHALNQGFIASKCDIVGHSMGGILSRLYAQRGGDNEINRLITVNTPHSGSEFGDAVMGHPVVLGLLSRAKYWKMNIDAVRDLAVESDAIAQLNSGPKPDIPVYAIATQKNKAATLAAELGVGAGLDNIGELCIKGGLAGGPLGLVVGLSAGISFKYFSHFVNDDLTQIGAGDLIVSTESQIGGCNSSMVIGDSGDGPWHCNSPKDSKVINALISLLTEDNDSPVFSKNWFNPSKRTFDHSLWQLQLGAEIAMDLSLNSKAFREATEGNDIESISLNKLKKYLKGELMIYNVVEGFSNFHEASDNNIARRANVQDGNRCLSVELNEIPGFSDPLVSISFGDMDASIAAGYKVELEVPSYFSGDANLTVFMKGTDGNVVYEDYVYTFDQPSVSPVSLEIEDVYLEKGDSVPIRLYCLWEDGQRTNVQPSNVVFENNGIADFVEGKVIGLKRGHTSATMSYAGLICNTTIRVFDSEEDENSDDNESSNSVCSTITLSFKQEMVMTRQAFRGTLTVNNGDAVNEMKDVKLNLEVKDEDDNIATSHEFQINAESLEGFEGEVDLTAGWKLVAKGTGVATILFIPTKYAAPTEPKLWSFGGTFSYIDPTTGLAVTKTLNPVTLTVNPSPSLELNYFMQRDVLGDDALTEDIVEPKVPAEFSLLINNKGYGDATNVKMVTNQPEIVDNEKGLLINFEILSSQLNGGEKTLALGQSVATEFGTISAGRTSYAQWWFTSSLLGHFTEYDVNATHLTSYGNSDLSLLDTVAVHELIHTLTIPKFESMRGFLVNDEKDDNKDMPDMLYMTDGTIKAVAQASATLTNDGDNIYTLTTVPTAAGWNYGNLVDPTSGHKVLSSITRQSDGQAIPLANFWQTDRTLRDGKDPLYEYRIHFADEMAAAGESYTLTFEDKPMTILAVETITSEKIKEGVIASDVDKVTVTFNKAVAASTFTTEDIELLCEGEKVDVSSIEIVKIDDKNFELNLKPAITVDGYYVLTVQAATIRDTESYAGEYGKQISWTQIVQQEVELEYDIPEGWSWISSNISSGAVTDAKSFLDPVKNKVNRLVGLEKELTNDPTYGLVGNLTTIQPVDGYKLYVNSPVQFSCSGIAGEPTSNVINLHQGWNWIGFLPIKAMSVEEAMKNHTPAENDLLKCQDAFTTYSDGMWAGTLTEMKPGEGYMYFSTQNASFIYPKAYASSASVAAVSLNRAIEVNAPWQYAAHKYADNCALIGKLFVDNEYDAEGNYFVGAFCENECRGVGVNINGLVYMVIHGTIGEKSTITFRAYNRETGSERNIQENFVFEGQNLGAVKSPTYLHAGNYTRISTLEAGFTISPRPIKNKLYIAGNTDAIKTVQILATNGKTVLKYEGYDQSGIDVGALLPAMYIIAIETNDGKICYDKVFKINN